MCIARNIDRLLLLDCGFGSVAGDDALVAMRLEQGNPRIFDEEDVHLLLTRALAEKMYRQLGRILAPPHKRGQPTRDSVPALQP